MPTLDRNALARAPWAELLQMRKAAQTQAEQDLLADYEHRAYAREQVAENPAMAVPYVAMVPGYQALKLLRGGAGSRSAASLHQLLQGYAGIGDGLAEATKAALRRR